MSHIRADPDAPIEETIEALHDVVEAGKARYIGASSPKHTTEPSLSPPPR